MTDSQRTLIAVLLDRSGSMETVKSDTEGGSNAFIDTQRAEPGDARVTLAQFDTEYQVVYANRPIGEVPRLALQPRGATALYDALGRLITDVGANVAALPEDQRPGTVDFLFLGANMDAVQIGTALGVKAEKSMTWDTTGGGVVNAMASAGAFVARKRSAPAGAAVAGFSEDDRAAALGNANK
jgi:hypothetical protein